MLGVFLLFGVAAATDSWDSFAGGLTGGILGTITGNAIVSAGKTSTASTGSADSEGTDTIQATVESNPGDLQGAIDVGRAAAGEEGAMAAATAVMNPEVRLMQSIEKMEIGFVRGKLADIKVRVPYSQKGSILSSNGRAGVLRGGVKSITNRAINALGVAAKVTGKALGVGDMIKYGGSSYTAFMKGDYLTATHDFGRAGMAFSGVFGLKHAGVIAEGVDGVSRYIGSKIYGY